MTGLGLLDVEVFVVLDDLADDGRVGQGSDVPEVVKLVGGHLAQDPPHDFAGPGLGQTAAELEGGLFSSFLALSKNQCVL